MRTEPTCAEVRYRLASGETLGRAWTRHLRSCPDCSAEATWMATLASHLMRGATVDPPAALDRAIVALLGGGASRRGPFRRPAMAAAFAGLGFISLVLGLAGVLAQGGAAEHGLTLALLLASAYLAVCAAALTPLLLPLRSGRPVPSRSNAR